MFLNVMIKMTNIFFLINNLQLWAIARLLTGFQNAMIIIRNPRLYSICPAGIRFEKFYNRRSSTIEKQRA